jgi:low affinity Fe/Cu permease
MEAISNKSGRKLHGKIAEILVRKGSATPVEELSEEELRLKQEEEAEKLRLIAEKKEAAKKAKEELRAKKVAEKKAAMQAKKEQAKRVKK